MTKKQPVKKHPTRKAAAPKHDDDDDQTWYGTAHGEDPEDVMSDEKDVAALEAENAELKERLAKYETVEPPPPQEWPTWVKNKDGESRVVDSQAALDKLKENDDTWDIASKVPAKKSE